MSILTPEKIKSLEASCNELSKLNEVRHVSVINKLGNIVAGGTKKGIVPMINEQKVRMVYMQLQLDYQMRKELDEILGPIDYIASRRKKLLMISVPIQDYLVLITANPDANDKKIINNAEKLFDELSFS
ncbi:MAG: DUF6659 family protein [Nitrosopumilaceae archaeon]